MKKVLKISASLWLILFFVGCDDSDAPLIGNSTTTFNSAQSFLNSRAPVAQQFTKDASSRFTIKSKNGLHYRFKANSFKTMSGQPVTGQVNIKLTEYLTKSDMVFSGVTTTSDNSVLESDAMFNLTVTQNGQELQLVDEYRVQVPSQDQNPEMIIFEGEEVEDSTGSSIIWVPSNTSSVVRDTFQSDTTWSDTTYDPGYYYTLRITFLSWCNLDRYVNSTTGSPVRLKINQANRKNCVVYLAIKELNGVVFLGYDHINDEYNSRNYNLPHGWDITLIVVYVDREKEQLEYAWVDSQTRANHLEEVDELKVISEADLEALVKTLQ